MSFPFGFKMLFDQGGACVSHEAVSADRGAETALWKRSQANASWASAAGGARVKHGRFPFCTTSEQAWTTRRLWHWLTQSESIRLLMLSAAPVLSEARCPIARNETQLCVLAQLIMWWWWWWCKQHNRNLQLFSVKLKSIPAILSILIPPTHESNYE